MSHPAPTPITRDPIPDFPSGDASANRNDLTRAIGARDEGRRQVAGTLGFDGEEIAIVERHGTNAHEHLTGRWLRDGLLDEREPVQRFVLLNDPRFHRAFDATLSGLDACWREPRVAARTRQPWAG